MHMNRQTVGICHPWNCRLGLDDDNLPEGRIPSRSDNSLETDLRNDTRTFVVEEGVGLVQWLTMERERKRETAEGRRQKGAQGDGGTRSTQRAEVHLSLFLSLFLSLLMVGCGVTTKDTDQRHVRILERFS